MKEIVVDSSISVKWFVPETNSDKAIEILKEYRNAKLSFLAPALIHAEYGNIIWKKQIFQKFDPIDAEFAIKEFQKIIITLTPTTALFKDAFQIAIQYQRTFYDSLYLALASRENCDFITADEKLFNAVTTAFPNVILLENWK